MIVEKRIVPVKAKLNILGELDTSEALKKDETSVKFGENCSPLCCLCCELYPKRIPQAG